MLAGIRVWPLTVGTMSLPWLSAGITAACTRSNGDTLPATVIPASECGQHVEDIEQGIGLLLSDPRGGGGEPRRTQFPPPTSENARGKRNLLKGPNF